MNAIHPLLLFRISLGVPEIIIFQLGAIILGFSIHFFWGRKISFLNPPNPIKDSQKQNEENKWRQKYFEEVDLRESVKEKLKVELDEVTRQKESLYADIEELQLRVRELSAPKKETSLGEPFDYLSQLKSAQENLSGHSLMIARLLDQVNILKMAEQKQLDTQKINEQLQKEALELRAALDEKEAIIRQLKHQLALANEMKGRLEQTYEEFSVLQNKIQMVESRISRPQSRGFEYEELQQSYFKLTKEYDEIKGKHLILTEESQKLSRMLADTEDKLREANFQRQQLTRKVGFLEELSEDLQHVSGQNKKLEEQLKRIGEIELFLSNAQK